MRRAVCVVHGDVFGLILEDDTVLNVLALDGLQHAVLGWELGDNSEWLRGIDLQTEAVEIFDIVTVGVVRAAALVAETSWSAVSTLACEETRLATRVGCDMCGAAVSLPDVHLIAADAGAVNIALLVVSKSTIECQKAHLQRH